MSRPRDQALHLAFQCHYEQTVGDRIVFRLIRDIGRISVIQPAQSGALATERSQRGGDTRVALAPPLIRRIKSAQQSISGFGRISDPAPKLHMKPIPYVASISPIFKRGELCRLGLSRVSCYQPRRWAQLGLNPLLRRPGSPIVWRPGERRPCSAGSSFCPSIALLPSAVHWRAASARF